MRNHVFDPVVLIAALAIFLVGAPPASANVAQPPERMAFEFFDEAGLPLIPESLQLVGCQEQECQTPVLLFQEGICNDPGCLPARGKIRMPFCSENFCRVDAYTFDYPHYGLILLPPAIETGDGARIGVFQDRPIRAGDVRGLHVVVTPTELEISEDAELSARIPGGSSGSCSPMPPSATIGFAITQIAEIAVVLLCLLMLRVPRKLIGGVLVAIGLINFATYPVVWFTFPALGPFQSVQEQALAVFTLLAALVYAGLLVRLRPAFDPSRRAIVVGLLAMALPMVTVLVFGAATVASAAMGVVGAGSVATAGTGLPYRVTMPASEVFAYTAEASLIALLCRPVLSARQAVLVAVLANSASLFLGLALL